MKVRTIVSAGVATTLLVMAPTGAQQQTGPLKLTLQPLPAMSTQTT